ncbi:SWIM zinc finger family protein [Actinoallomurus sp. CA-150999]|uniref:SWIM zinc finger family protein n=1 Tax=Actinoallomurus sp. CA-150999 TaxID=3239887 RepID=UPI003D8F27F4
MPAEFGATLWGRAWLRTVEPTTVSRPNPLLPKARSLARNAAVTLRTAEAGRLDAEVSARGVVHRVAIEFPCWSDELSAEVTGLVADAAPVPGDLPDGLEAALTRRGTDIAAPVGERVADCGCGAGDGPCAHVLAVLYALVQRIDETPALAVELRCRAPFRAAADPDWIPLSDVPVEGFYGT